MESDSHTAVDETAQNAQVVRMDEVSIPAASTKSPGTVAQKRSAGAETGAGMGRRRAAAQSSKQCFVYFVQVCPDGPIKIGISGDPKSRISSLRVSNPSPLEVIGIIEGGERLESGLHRMLDPHRIRGEWFAPHSDVLRLIALMMLADMMRRDSDWQRMPPDAIDMAKKMAAGELPQDAETGRELAMRVLGAPAVRLVMRFMSIAATHEERVAEYVNATKTEDGKIEHARMRTAPACWIASDNPELAPTSLPEGRTA